MTSLRGLIAVALALLVASAISLPEHAGADVQYFPVPAVGTSKNDGNDVGLIVPILITDPDGELKYLVAPMVIHNSIVGRRGAINLFRYEPGGREIRFIGIVLRTDRAQSGIQLRRSGLQSGTLLVEFWRLVFQECHVTVLWLRRNDAGVGRNELHGALKDGRTGDSGSTRTKSPRLPLASGSVHVQLQKGATISPLPATYFLQSPGLKGRHTFSGTGRRFTTIRAIISLRRPMGWP